MGLLDVLGDALARVNTKKPEYGPMSPELAAQYSSGGLTGGLLRAVNPMMFRDDSAWNRWVKSPVGTPMGREAMQEALPALVGIFAGPNAKTADLTALAKAERLAAGGADNEAIRQATGWFKGMDGKWRFEIPDNESKIFTTNSGRQIDVRARALSGGKAWNTLEHEKLYSAYPHLEDISISMNGGLSGKIAAYDSTGNIQLSPALDLVGDTPRPLLLHELQHAIQEREGFARGGSPESSMRGMPDGQAIADAQVMAALVQRGTPIEDATAAFLNMVNRDSHPAAAIILRENSDDLNRIFSMPTNGMDAYRRLAGEIEARDVSARMNLTPEQRLATPPDLRPDAIVRFKY